MVGDTKAYAGVEKLEIAAALGPIDIDVPIEVVGRGEATEDVAKGDDDGTAVDVIKLAVVDAGELVKGGVDTDGVVTIGLTIAGVGTFGVVTVTAGVGTAGTDGTAGTWVVAAGGEIAGVVAGAGPDAVGGVTIFTAGDTTVAVDELVAAPDGMEDPDDAAAAVAWPLAAAAGREGLAGAGAGAAAAGAATVGAGAATTGDEAALELPGVDEAPFIYETSLQDVPSDPVSPQPLVPLLLPIKLIIKSKIVYRSLMPDW